MSKDLTICYNGIPIKPKYKGRTFSWLTIFKMLRCLGSDGFLYIDGWKFNISYGLLYLKENKKWKYYLPLNGVKDKLILDVGGGCGETAKFFLEHEALRVNIIEMNEKCEKFLAYNSFHHYHNIGYKIKKFSLNDIFENKYDLIKMDIEGYEIELLPYLDDINVDMVVETHSQYITDKFIEKGFSYINPNTEKDIEIYGGVNILCRWKK